MAEEDRERSDEEWLGLCAAGKLLLRQPDDDDYAEGRHSLFQLPDGRLIYRYERMRDWDFTRDSTWQILPADCLERALREVAKGGLYRLNLG